MTTDVNSTNPSENPVASGKKYPVILGLGGAGSAILEQYMKLPGAGSFLTVLIDTDSSVVDQSHAMRKLLLTPDWGGSVCTNGCGGDVRRGSVAFTRERNRVEDLLADAESIIVCGGLGGGTLAGGLPTIISIIRNLKVASAVVVTLPFDMELFARRTSAQQALREIQPTTDILIALPNDLLMCTLPPETPLEAALTASSREMALAVFGMASVMHAKSPLGGGYAQMLSVLKQERCDCTLGVGVAGKDDGLDRCTLALERLLASPFLGSMDFLKQCDAAFLTVCGGPDLQIAEVKRTLEQAGNILPANMDVSTGISISPDLVGQVQFTVIAIQYAQDSTKRKQPDTAAQSPEVELFNGNAPNVPQVGTGEKGMHLPAGVSTVPLARVPSGTPVPVTVRQGRKNKQPKDHNWTQQILTLEDVSYGIFEGTDHVCAEEQEDLDLPTYYRQNIEIDRG